MKKILTILMLLVALVSCTPRVEVDHRMHEGNIDFCCDESYANVLAQQVFVFTRTNPGAFIDMTRCTERDALNALLEDSVRLITMTRRLTASEKNRILENQLNCNETHIAVDAIAFVVNKNNPDSILTVENIRSILTGEVTQWSELFPQSKLGKIQVIFDNRNSSTVRYAVDSICAPDALYNGVAAVDNTLQVVNEVSKRRNAIGVIGAGWINALDSAEVRVRDRVSPVRVKKTPDAKAFGPFQAYIASADYPYFRSIYMINTESNNGLCTGFTIFVAGQRGQKIFEKSNISPARIEERVINLKNEF
ncbi:MAG: substrate-binding domain-containing protein [Bacteroidaceae bacterium]|nr:substrate-binding domain-containing protein [Bacteroidaceae bacterium]